MRSKLQNFINKWIITAFTFAQFFIVCQAVLAEGSNTGATAKCSNAVATTNIKELITLNFEETDIRTILIYLAKITGDTILPDKSVRGNFTIINPKPLTPEQAEKIIYSVLEMQGFTVVRYNGYVKVVKSADAKTQPIKTIIPPK